MSSVDVAKDLLAQSLQIDIAEVTEDMALGVSDRWDSLAHTRLILALEEKLGRPIETDEMLSIENYQTLVDILST